MYTVYILYSKALDRYYIGQTMDINNRIEEHNSEKYDDSYTKRACDWRLYFSILCQNRTEAIKIEHHIKKMHSRVFLENLKRYPEISEKIIAKYSNKKF